MIGDTIWWAPLTVNPHLPPPCPYLLPFLHPVMLQVLQLPPLTTHSPPPSLTLAMGASGRPPRCSWHHLLFLAVAQLHVLQHHSSVVFLFCLLIEKCILLKQKGIRWIVAHSTSKRIKPLFCVCLGDSISSFPLKNSNRRGRELSWHCTPYYLRFILCRRIDVDKSWLSEWILRESLVSEKWQYKQGGRLDFCNFETVEL